MTTHEVTRLFSPAFGMQRVTSRNYRTGFFGKGARLSAVLVILVAMLQIFASNAYADANPGGYWNANGSTNTSNTMTYTTSGTTLTYTATGGLNQNDRSGTEKLTYVESGGAVYVTGIWLNCWQDSTKQVQISGNQVTAGSPQATKSGPDQANSSGTITFTVASCATSASGPPRSFNVITYNSGYNSYALYTLPLTYVPTPSPGPTDKSGGNSCTMTDVALVRLARGAGFPESAIQTAVAIALAESGGKVNALHYNPPDPGSWDIGLWQINDVAHPTYDRDQLYSSPGYNASKAYDVWLNASPANSFTPWKTFQSGAYNQFMTRAATAMSQASTGTLGGASCSNLSGADTVANGGTNTPADDDPNCTFTFNVFKILKCAFIPSASDQSKYSAQMTTIQNTGAVSFVTGTVTFVSNTVNIAASCGGTCPANNTPYTCNCSGFTALPLTPLNDINHQNAINPIVQAGDWMQGTSSTAGVYANGHDVQGVAHFFYTAMQISIYALFAFYWFKRLTGSLGGRE